MTMRLLVIAFLSLLTVAFAKYGLYAVLTDYSTLKYKFCELDVEKKQIVDKAVLGEDMAYDFHSGAYDRVGNKYYFAYDGHISQLDLKTGDVEIWSDIQLDNRITYLFMDEYLQILYGTVFSFASNDEKEILYSFDFNSRIFEKVSVLYYPGEYVSTSSCILDSLTNYLMCGGVDPDKGLSALITFNIMDGSVVDIDENIAVDVRGIAKDIVTGVAYGFGASPYDMSTHLVSLDYTVEHAIHKLYNPVPLSTMSMTGFGAAFDDVYYTFVHGTDMLPYVETMSFNNQHHRIELGHNMTTRSLEPFTLDYVDCQF